MTGQANSKVVVPLKKCLTVFRHASMEIAQHPYCRALQEDERGIYEEAIAESKFQSQKPSGTWEGLHKLLRKVAKKGINPRKSPIHLVAQSDGRYLCRHGRHRLCILWHLYGSEGAVEVSKERVIKVLPKKFSEALGDNKKKDHQKK